LAGEVGFCAKRKIRVEGASPEYGSRGCSPHPDLKAGFAVSTPQEAGRGGKLGRVLLPQKKRYALRMAIRLARIVEQSSASPRARRQSSRCSRRGSCRAAVGMDSARARISRHSTSTAGVVHRESRIARWLARGSQGRPPTVFIGWQRSGRQTFDAATRHIYDRRHPAGPDDLMLADRNGVDSRRIRRRGKMLALAAVARCMDRARGRHDSGGGGRAIRLKSRRGRTAVGACSAELAAASAHAGMAYPEIPENVRVAASWDWRRERL